MPRPISDFSRLCIHTMTTKPWPLAQAVTEYAKAGIPGITVWRRHIEPYGPEEAARMLHDSGLEVVSLCRGGFFPAESAAGRRTALDNNRRVLDEAAAIGAPVVVLVCGAVPGMPLDEARGQILDGIWSLLPHAEGLGVKLSIEPLHPMYAGDRSAVNTLRQANDMAEALGSPWVGVTVDVYHVWWDPELEAQIARAGSSIFSFHVCDWRTPTRDLLNDRALMGEGCIQIPRIRGWVEAAGFQRYNEVEIFSSEYWARDQTRCLAAIKDAYLRFC
jgi:sugar phosphate isomerase/epimerase